MTFEESVVSRFLSEDEIYGGRVVSGSDTARLWVASGTSKTRERF